MLAVLVQDRGQIPPSIAPKNSYGAALNCRVMWLAIFDASDALHEAVA